MRKRGGRSGAGCGISSIGARPGPRPAACGSRRPAAAEGFPGLFADVLVRPSAAWVTMWPATTEAMPPDTCWIDALIERYGHQSRFVLGVSDMVTADVLWDRLAYITERIASLE